MMVNDMFSIRSLFGMFGSNNATRVKRQGENKTKREALGRKTKGKALERLSVNRSKCYVCEKTRETDTMREVKDKYGGKHFMCQECDERMKLTVGWYK